MEKSRYVRVIEMKEARGDGLIKYFLHTGIGSTFESQGLMAVEIHQNEKIHGGMRDGGRKGIGSAIRRRANRESINIKE